MSVYIEKNKYPKLNASHFTGFQRTSTYVNPFWFAINEDANLLNVNSPSTLVFIVSVGHVIS